ncbi:MAG: SDR family NAD(P)-dependent oxidoreductase [Solirubrobacterales bacterium]
MTGAGRRAGIGFAIARRLLKDGARVMVHSFDETDGSVDEAFAELGGESDSVATIDSDPGDRDAPHMVIERTVEAFGAVDAVVVNHAHSSDQSLAGSPQVIDAEGGFRRGVAG